MYLECARKLQDRGYRSYRPCPAEIVRLFIVVGPGGALSIRWTARSSPTLKLIILVLLFNAKLQIVVVLKQLLKGF